MNFDKVAKTLDKLRRLGFDIIDPAILDTSSIGVPASTPENQLVYASVNRWHTIGLNLTSPPQCPSQDNYRPPSPEAMIVFANLVRKYPAVPPNMKTPEGSLTHTSVYRWGLIYGVLDVLNEISPTPDVVSKGKDYPEGNKIQMMTIGDHYPLRISSPDFVFWIAPMVEP